MNEPKYRLLQKGEKLHRGDQFRWDGKWEKWEGYEYENSQIIGVRYRTQRPHQSEPKPKEDGSPVAGMTPEQMRRAAMDEMNKIPALANHHSWKGWPGTWAFATAAVNGITAKAEDAHQPTKEAEKP